MTVNGAMIPVEVEDKENGKRNGKASLVDKRLVTIMEPYSIASEQYRVLYTKIDQLGKQKTSYAIAITSSIKGEGKTFTSLNLAISMARDFNEKVLLMEGDLKNPDLHEYLKRPPGFGLSDIIEGRIDFNSSCVELFDGKLSVLLAGKISGNPAKLLSSFRFKEMIDKAKRDFKYIIIDTPPVIPLVDVNIYSTYVDGILLIIRAGKTPRSLVKKAISSIPSEKVIGTILNDVEQNHSKYYYAAGYSY